MPNPARLMGTRERTEDGSQESQREKRDRTSAAWQSRAELQSGVGWKWCHFPDVRGSGISSEGATPKSPSETLPQDEL